MSLNSKLSNIINWGEGTKILYKDTYSLSDKEKQILKILFAQGTPPSFRKKLWMQSTSALREMKNNPKYYQNLLEYSNKVKGISEFQISLDLKRTFPEDPLCMSDEYLLKLRNILLCYSIRNSTVGYCQGMNFIVGRLLLVVEDEEEAFWIFVQIVENLLPLNYYSDLAGLLTETTLILFLIEKHLPRLYDFFLSYNFEQSLNNFIHKWLVSLFTQNFDHKINMLVWDYFFLEGSIILSKACIGLFVILENDILSQTNFEDIYQVLNEKTNQITTTNQLFYFLHTRQYEFNDELLGKFRNILQIPIIENLQKEKQKKTNYSQNRTIHSLFKSKKRKEKECNPNWPICNYDNSIYDVPEYIILKCQKKPNIMIDYYYLKVKNYPKTNTRIDELLIDEDKDVLVQRKKHKCIENKIIENSIVFLDEERVNDDEDSSPSKEGQKEPDIYVLIKQGEHFKKALEGILNKYSPEPINENELKNIS